MLKFQKLNFLLANSTSAQLVTLTKREGGNTETMHKLMCFFKKRVQQTPQL